MKALILFDLKRRFLNRMSLLINVLIVLVIFFLFHADYFLGNNQRQRQFYFDDSVKPFRDCFQQLERDYRLYNGQIGEQDILIHFDGHFTISSHTPVEEELLAEIKEELRQAVKQHYLQQYPQLSPLVSEFTDVFLDIRQKNEKPAGLWLISSLLYFLMMNYSSTIASEVVYEKSAHLLESLMTSLSPQKHMLAKVLEGYLTVLIQIILTGLYASVAFLFRYLEDGFKGLNEFLSSGDVGYFGWQLPVNWQQVLLIAGLMVSSLLIVQTLMLLVCSGLTSSQQAAAVQGVFYVLLLAVYYVLLMQGENWVLNGKSVVFYAGIPVASGYLMSCLVLLKKASLLQGLLAMGINIVTLLLIIEIGGRKYRQNLLRF